MKKIKSLPRNPIKNEELKCHFQFYKKNKKPLNESYDSSFINDFLINYDNSTNVKDFIKNFRSHTKYYITVNDAIQEEFPINQKEKVIESYNFNKSSHDNTKLLIGIKEINYIEFLL